MRSHLLPNFLLIRIELEFAVPDLRSGVPWGKYVKRENLRRHEVGSPVFDYRSSQRSKDFKSWYSQLPCLMFSIKGIV